MRTLSRRLARDESGATFVEAAILIPLVFVFLFGAVEFLFAFHQWNRALKAVERGARLAVVSNPVDSGLVTLLDVVPGSNAGAPVPAGYFRSICSGASSSCTGTRAGAFDVAALRRIVFGRGAQSCTGAASPYDAGMCDLYPAITTANVVVEYAQTGLGFVQRPGGPVPSVTVSLTGLQFRFFFLDSLLGLGPIQMPPMRVTLTGEDLLSAPPPAR